VFRPRRHQPPDALASSIVRNLEQNEKALSTFSDMLLPWMNRAFDWLGHFLCTRLSAGFLPFLLICFLFPIFIFRLHYPWYFCLRFARFPVPHFQRLFSFHSIYFSSSLPPGTAFHLHPASELDNIPPAAANVSLLSRANARQRAAAALKEEVCFVFRGFESIHTLVSSDVSFHKKKFVSCIMFVNPTTHWRSVMYVSNAVYHILAPFLVISFWIFSLPLFRSLRFFEQKDARALAREIELGSRDPSIAGDIRPLSTARPNVPAVYRASGTHNHSHTRTHALGQIWLYALFSAVIALYS
jgi:hypothetical protein